MATVTKIPATLSRFTAAPLASMAKRKVAAYARVSTDHEEQQSSYEAQVDYYTHYIQSRDDCRPFRVRRHYAACTSTLTNAPGTMGLPSAMHSAR